MFGSALTGAANLVLYSDAFTGVDTVTVYDPHNALPKNQPSWEMNFTRKSNASEEFLPFLRHDL